MRALRLGRRLFAVGLTLFALVPVGGRPSSLATAAAAPAPPPVVVVMLENQEDVKLTATNAPYLTNLKDRGRYFSRYYGVAHPSFPNYVAFAGGSTFGFAGGPVKAGMIQGRSLWDQLTDAGLSWGVYEEHMPSTCYAKASKVVTTPTKDKYAINHNPGTVFSNVFSSSECQQVRPLSAMPMNPLALSFVTPSYCNDMHGMKDQTYPADCQTKSSALISRSDDWLRLHVEDWLAAGAIVVITFDEGTTKAGTGGHIYTVEVGPGVDPSVDATTYNHYSLLAGLEDRFGLEHLRNAGPATPLPIG
jgi:phosphatidylinositol-3-phosphatase